MKKSVVVLFIIFAMLHVAWGKSGNETKLEKLRFACLTSDSVSWSLIYKYFEKKKFYNKRSSVILIDIQGCLFEISSSMPLAGTNNGSKESSIYNNIRCNIKSNNSILVKFITSSPDLYKNAFLPTTLAFLLYFPISAQDKELVQKFIKKHYSLKQISATNSSNMLVDNLVTPENTEEFFFLACSSLRRYTKLLHTLSLFRDGKISEIKCFIRNQIEYNHILISLILQRNPVYVKEEIYVDYQKNLIIQKIVSDYESKKQKRTSESRQ